MSRIFRYRILVQVRTDLTSEEIRKYEASKGPNAVSPSQWPMRDTGEIFHGRRARTVCAFYRAFRGIRPLIKIRAVRIKEIRFARRNDMVAYRAWRGFDCLCGAIGGVEDEVKHFSIGNGVTACGLEFTKNHWTVHGKPECDECLAAAVDKHPEMKQYL